MSCGCGSSLWGGKCCGGPGQIALVPPAGGVLPATSDLSALTIYNVVNAGMTPNGAPDVNSAALTTAFTAASNNGGGTIFFPLATYQLNSGLILIDGTSLVGSGTKTTLVCNTNGDLFSIKNSGNSTGVTINNFKIAYHSGFQATSGAFHFGPNCQDMHLTNIWFQNCAVAYFDDSALQCGVDRSTLDIGVTIPNLTWITMDGSQTYVSNNVFRTAPTQGVTNGNIGILVKTCSTGYITNNHISGPDYGIKFLHGAEDMYVIGNRIDSGLNAVLFAPDTPAQLHGAYFIGGTYKQRVSFTTVASAFFIDTNGQPNTAITNVQLDGVSVHDWYGHGVQINSGEHIQLIGGRISSCGGGGPQFANVAVTGGSAGPDLVTIDGTDCSAVFPSSPYTTTIGLLVSANAPTVVRARGVDFTGCAVPVSVTGTATVTLDKCPGYNDQKKVVLASAPLVGQPTSAAAHGYYGDSRLVFSASAPVNVTINGAVISQQSGSHFLGPYDTIQFSGPIVTFSWLGVW